MADLLLLNKLGFFRDFYGAKKCEKIIEKFFNIYKKTKPTDYTKKTLDKKYNEILEFEISTPNEDFTTIEYIKSEIQLYGQSNKTINTSSNIVYITNIDKKIVTYYQLNTSKICRVKLRSKDKLKEGDIIEIIGMKEEPRWRIVNEKWSQSPEYGMEMVLRKFNKIEI
jgi:hypothetical protein